MKLGIIENLWREADEGALFRRAARIDAEGVEIVYSGETSSNGADRLRRLKTAQTGGPEVPAVQVAHLASAGFADSDTAQSETALQHIRTALYWATELGAQVVVVPPIFSRAVAIPEDAWGRMIQGFQTLCAEASQRGIRIAYRSPMLSRDLLQLADQVNSSAFGVVIDAAYLIEWGMDPAAELLALGSLVHHVYLNDIHIHANDCHPGRGQVDYIAIADALRQIGYDGWVVVQTPSTLPELVARALSFVRYWLPELASRRRYPRIGAMSWDFKYPAREINRVVDEFSRYGLEAVQIGGDILADVVENPDRGPVVRAAFEDNGIEVVGLAGYRNLTAPDPTKRRANIDFIKRCLEIASSLGTSVVATETGTYHPESDWRAMPENWGEAAWDTLHAALDEIVEVAEANQTCVALEGYVNNILQTPAQMTRLLERYPGPNVQVVCDPFNYLSSQLLPVQERVTRDFLHRFEDRFVLAHLKDVDSGGAEVKTPEFGQGVFVFRPYFDFLKSHRPDLAIILEHLPSNHIPKAIQRYHAMMSEAKPT